MESLFVYVQRLDWEHMATLPGRFSVTWALFMLCSSWSSSERLLRPCTGDAEQNEKATAAVAPRRVTVSVGPVCVGWEAGCRYGSAGEGTVRVCVLSRARGLSKHISVCALVWFCRKKNSSCLKVLGVNVETKRPVKCVCVQFSA